MAVHVSFAHFYVMEDIFVDHCDLINICPVYFYLAVCCHNKTDVACLDIYITVRNGLLMKGISSWS